MDERFADFLKTGSLGPLRLGMTFSDVQTILPRPEPTMVFGAPGDLEQGSCSWQYDDLQIVFFKGIVDSFLIEFDFDTDALVLPKELRLRGAFPPPGTALADFRQCLEVQGIRYAVDLYWVRADRLDLTFLDSGRVSATFGCEGTCRPEILQALFSSLSWKPASVISWRDAVSRGIVPSEERGRS